jgi:hypothetical protein
LIGNVVTEFVEAESSPKNQPAVPKTEGFLHVSGFVRHVSVGTRGDTDGNAGDSRIQTYVYLVVVEIDAGGERRGNFPNFVDMNILRVRAFLQTGIVLLERVAV